MDAHSKLAILFAALMFIGLVGATAGWAAHWYVNR